MPFEDVKPTGFGIPKLIIGAVAGADQGLDRLTVHAAQGRLLTAADEGSRVTVLGADMAREFGLAPGGTIALRGVHLRHRRRARADADRPGHDGDGAARRGPGAVPRDAAAEDRRGPPRERAGLEDRRLPRRGDRRGRAGEPHQDPRQPDHDHQRRLGPAGRQRLPDLQRDHPRRRAHQPHRRWAVGHQHDGHERHRADPRDRHQAGDRQLASPDHPGTGRGGRAHRVDRRRSSASRWGPSWSSSPTRPAAARERSCST